MTIRADATPGLGRGRRHPASGRLRSMVATRAQQSGAPKIRMKFSGRGFGAGRWAVGGGAVADALARHAACRRPSGRPLVLPRSGGDRVYRWHAAVDASACMPAREPRAARDLIITIRAEAGRAPAVVVVERRQKRLRTPRHPRTGALA